MATVTTTSTGTAEMTMYRSPAARAGAVLDAPIGEIEFSDSFAIPAKLAADENFIVINCTLPRNYFYRLRYLNVFLTGSNSGDLNDYDAAMAWMMYEDSAIRYYFGAYAQGFGGNYYNGNTFKWNEDAVTNDYGIFYLPRDPIRKVLIDASTGVSMVKGQLLDSSTNANAATNIDYQIEFDTYTIDQAKSYQVNRAILTM